MSIQSRKPLIVVGALVAALSAPLAFAQSSTASPTSQDPAAAHSSASASGAASSGKKSWADVDLDKNGSLSKTEASAVPALGQVFDQADADADGALTADEYKAYVAKAQTGAGAGDRGGKR
ncbi:EF-hand domain-containing protein [Lysobacter sp. LF1]|uniref:EF-hand domain-containing protein n=1 Tax=Lysobacter stagni TaxID=3045172 RepID=A0ABT6XES0_9GAMM|nr:EF-hand domain-containing protein [Lysobacter sp. LF1]MDI9238630.1 EF-hand domain-containing protein [Lysobacter sp. LF1]